MSAQNKILILAIAIVAFAIGIAVNTARVSPVLDSQPLLQAKLQYQGKSTAVASQLGEMTLVNFWATWCTPCREEMPLFEAMYRNAKPHGFQVIGIAIDNPETAQPMLDSMDISYPIFYAEKTGTQVMESVGNPQGLLPYSLLLDANGDVLDQVLGTVDETQINEWLNTYLPASAGSNKTE